MEAVINLSLFQYKCININQDEELFTYKTDKNTAKKINQELISCFKQICDSENILKNLFIKKNNHKVKELEKRNLILEIFKKFGYKEKYVDQYIGDNPIFQIKTKGERRLFFIIENKETIKKEKIIIIKPLFLDVNHVIYNDKRFQKNFQICSIYLEKDCEKKLNF